MALNTVQVTGTFDDGSGSPLTGTAVFTPNTTVYASGVPVLQPDVPVEAEIVGGQLRSLSDGTLALIATDNSGLSYIGQTSFFFWTVQVTLGGQALDPWSFFLPHASLGNGPIDLYSLANTPASGPAVTSVFGRTGAVVAASGDYTVSEVTGAAPLASPALTGTPTAPTASGGTNTTQLATTAFATAAANAAQSAAEAASDAAGSAAAAQAAAEAYSSPTTTLGDTIYGGASGVPARLAGNTTATRKFWRQVGTGSASAAPAWDVLQSGDLPAATTSVQGAVQLDGTTGDIQALAASASAGSTGKAADAGHAHAAPGMTWPAYLAPTVTVLTDGAAIAVNAALGNDFRVTIGGNRTMDAPSNAKDGLRITFEVIQDGTGSRTLTWASGAGGYDFGTAGAPVLSTAAGAIDQVAFRYSASKGEWLCLGSALGF